VSLGVVLRWVASAGVTLASLSLCDTTGAAAELLAGRERGIPVSIRMTDLNRLTLLMPRDGFTDGSFANATFHAVTAHSIPYSGAALQGPGCPLRSETLSVSGHR